MNVELTLDTSTRYASVAVSREGQVAAELSWRSERNHSVELVPAIHRAAEQASASLDEVSAVFVALGPGGFSALRVGVSMAKAFAAARGAPLVGVCTLDVEAEPYLAAGLPVCAVIGAGRSKAYTALYGAGRDAGYRVQSHEELAMGLNAKTLFCGEGLSDTASLIRERAGSLAALADVPPPTRRPSVLARLGYDRLRNGSIDDPETLEPMYMRAAQIASANRARKEP